MDSEQQGHDREWEEEESSEGVQSNNRSKQRATPRAANRMSESIQDIKQLLEQDFNKRMEIIKAEF